MTYPQRLYRSLGALACCLASACAAASPASQAAAADVAAAKPGDAATAETTKGDAAAAGDDVVANPGTGAPAKATALRTATINASSYAAPGSGQQSGSMYAQFLDQDPSPFQTQQETVGPCLVRTATATGSGGFPKYASAGTVTLVTSQKTVNLAPVASGYNPFTSQDARLWIGGEDLWFHAPGAVVGSFSVHLTAPDHVVVTQPPQQMGVTLTVARDAPLQWAWTGASSGVLEVALQGPQAAGQTSFFSATCRFAIADGKGEIPAAVLQKLAAGDKGFLVGHVVADTETVAGNYGSIRVRAETPALAGNKVSQYVNPVVFQ